MKIVAVAIKVLKENDYEIWIHPYRHADIWERMHDLKISYDKEKCIEGFMTDTNEFVDRYEAKKIAIAAKQLIVSEEETYAELYSEDLW